MELSCPKFILFLGQGEYEIKANTIVINPYNIFKHQLPSNHILTSKIAKCCTYVVPENKSGAIFNNKSRRFLFDFYKDGETTGSALCLPLSEKYIVGLNFGKIG